MRCAGQKELLIQMNIGCENMCPIMKLGAWPQLE
jgi:hypothetical protein